MKESAHAAITCVRQLADRYGISPDFYAKKDIHIHFPEGAVPKDGPSAGVTVITALVSALSGIPVRRDVAMTGEITVRGKVLPIGGLREKTMAAYSAGVSTILIPADNMKNLNEVDPLVRENVTFIPCRTATEVLSSALAVPEAEFVHTDIVQRTLDIDGATVVPSSASEPRVRRATSDKDSK
jgi:ATP-dependent Lon protease